MKKTSLYFISAFLVIIFAQFCPAGTAVFYDRTLPSDSKIPAAFIDLLKEAQVDFELLDSPKLCDSNIFNIKKYDSLIIPDSSVFPVLGAGPLTDFVQNGGDLILLGGPAFANCYDFIDGQWVRQGYKKFNGQWLDIKDVRDKIALDASGKANNLFTFEEQSFADWEHISRYQSVSSRIYSEEGVSGKAARFELKYFKVSGWNLWQTKIAKKTKRNDNCISFWAKGDENTPQVVIEIIEKDLSTWIAVIDLKKSWNKYALTCYDFKFHPTPIERGRGGNGDYVKIGNADKLLLGLSAYATAGNGDHNIWLDEIGTSKCDIPDNLPAAKSCSIRFFADYVPYLLQSPVELTSNSSENILCNLPRVKTIVNAPVYAAQGFTSADKSLFVPLLLSGQDRLGGPSYAGGMVVNYSGRYKDSAWIYFGITAPDFYRSSAFGEYIKSLLNLTKDPQLFSSAEGFNDRQKTLDKKYGAFNYAIGTQAFSAMYQLTGDDLLVEQAKAIADMGSNVLKCEISSRSAYIYNFKEKIRPQNLRQFISTSPSYKKILDMPFDYYLFWTYECGLEFGGGDWRNGMTDKEKETLYNEFYDFCCYLLQQYNNTGKTFYLGHWEGDWMLLKGYTGDPKPKAIKGMIDWLNIRQKAVDDAKKNIVYSNVEIFNYTEVTRVIDSMKGLDTLTNNVLPFTNVDYVSYSSYDSLDRDQGDEAIGLRYKKSLDFLESKLPAKDIPGKRVFIGEYGFQRSYLSDAFEQERLSRIVTCSAFEWGCPFVLYWQMYCNVGQSSRNDFAGFWLIDNKGIKQPTYLMHYNFLQKSKAFVNKFRENNGRNPTQSEYRNSAQKWLCTGN
ncbi:MAG: hypothetical protein WC496_06870 [Phycisphaerae bacterium]|jgi:hypothetical protein